MSNKKTKTARQYKEAARKDVKLFRARAEEVRKIAVAAQQGAQELSMLTNSVLISTAIQYGEKLPEGGYSLELPKLNVPELLDRYDLMARTDPITGSYKLIAIAKIEPKA